MSSKTQSNPTDVCRTETERSSLKYENCKIPKIEPLDSPYNTEDEFQFIDAAEVRDDFEIPFFELTANSNELTNTLIYQDIKEEPELEIQEELEKTIEDKALLTICEKTLPQVVQFKNVKKQKKRDDVTMKIPRYECIDCGKSFKRRALLTAHQVRTNHKNVRFESDTIKRTGDLKVAHLPRNRRFKKKPNSTTVDLNEDLDYASSSTIEVDANPKDMKSIQKDLTTCKRTLVGNIVYECRICMKITKNRRDHLKHIVNHTGRTLNECVFCLEHFETKDLLDKHIEEHHLHLQKNDTSILPNGIIKCNLCNKNFMRIFDFDQHQKWHNGEMMHQCDICHAYFANRRILHEHKKKLHEDSQNLPKKFLCFICGEKFSYQFQLTNHKKSHLEMFELFEKTTIIQRDSTKLTYTCKTCGKSTKCQSRHVVHLRVHSKEKPFKCDLCGKQFSAKCTLKDHKRLHTTERPFKCEICDKSYRHRRNLRTHLTKHAGEPPFKCDYCKRTFFHNTSCKEHIRRIHTGETPFQCNICAEWFTCSDTVRMHKLRNHNVDTRQKRTVDILS